MANNVSAEKSLAAGVVISLVIAAVASRIPQLSFGSFLAMFVVLVGGNVVLYLLTKLGLFKSG